MLSRDEKNLTASVATERPFPLADMLAPTGRVVPPCQDHPGRDRHENKRRLERVAESATREPRIAREPREDDGTEDQEREEDDDARRKIRHRLRRLGKARGGRLQGPTAYGQCPLRVDHRETLSVAACTTRAGAVHRLNLHHNWVRSYSSGCRMRIESPP